MPNEPGCGTLVDPALLKNVLTTLTAFAIEASLRTAAAVELTEIIAGREAAPLRQPPLAEPT